MRKQIFKIKSRSKEGDFEDIITSSALGLALNDAIDNYLTIHHPTYKRISVQGGRHLNQYVAQGINEDQTYAVDLYIETQE